MNKREVVFALIGFLERLDGMTDCILIGVLHASDYLLPQSVTMFIFDVKFIRKMFFFVVLLAKQLKYQGEDEFARNLQNSWKLAVTQGFYVLENFINKFSPSDVVRLSLRKSRATQPLQVNFKTLLFVFIFFVEILPILTIYLALFFDFGMKLVGSSAAKRILIYATIKQLFMLGHAMLQCLLFKPAQIGQTHFDEALITLQYKKAQQRFKPVNRKQTILPNGLDV